jgi:ubiquitin carboxyl-terminal hydrolase 14
VSVDFEHSSSPDWCPPNLSRQVDKKHNVDLDPTSNGETFKFQLYSFTGVEPNRQKVLIEMRVLKDSTDLSTLNAKPGQTFFMIRIGSG